MFLISESVAMILYYGPNYALPHRPPPLTEEERLLKEVRDLEAAASTGTSAKKSHVKGIDVPMKDEVKKALIGLSDGSNGQNLIQLVKPLFFMVFQGLCDYVLTLVASYSQ